MSKYEANMKDEIKRIIQESNESDWSGSMYDKENALLDENIQVLYDGYENIKKNPEESKFYSGIEEYVYTTLGL